MMQVNTDVNKREAEGEAEEGLPKTEEWDMASYDKEMES
jgi:hypothetical protein